jgi:hypothetical protein
MSAFASVLCDPLLGVVDGEDPVADDDPVAGPNDE